MLDSAADATAHQVQIWVQGAVESLHGPGMQCARMGAAVQHA